jgi:hypothetical protein
VSGVRFSTIYPEIVENAAVCVLLYQISTQKEIPRSNRVRQTWRFGEIFFVFV